MRVVAAGTKGLFGGRFGDPLVTANDVENESVHIVENGKKNEGGSHSDMT